MAERRNDDLSHDVRLFPIFMGLTMVFAWAAEVGLCLGHFLTNGKWPAPVKYWVVGIIAVVLSIYKLKVPSYRREMRNCSLNAKQALLIFCFALAWSLVGAWIMVGPPGPNPGQ